MGQTSKCTLEYGGHTAAGTAHLETKSLDFRGDLRLSIPFDRVRAIAARDGRLSLTLDDGTAVFNLGAKAETWAAKIRNPKSVLDKLGVKPTHRVAVVGLADSDFLAQLTARAAHVTTGAPDGAYDLVFYAAHAVEDLGRLGILRTHLVSNGALWVIRPKGVRAITEADVMDAGKSVGLVDVKVVSFSETHTAEKFVIRLVDR